MVRIDQMLVTALAVSAVALVAGAGGCGGTGSQPGFDVPDDGGAGSGSILGDNGSDDSGTGPGDDGGLVSIPIVGDASPPPQCAGGGLSCYVPKGCTTSLTGNVYDPAGRNPLYNVVVFVPNDPQGTVPPITPGTHSCNTCDVSIGNYVAATTTDSKGHFTLTGVPATSRVPLVMQVGKWRRKVFLSQVKGCAQNAVPASLTRLPRNRSEGDMPQMALLTGGCDDLGCFMSSLGIDPSEFSPPHGGGRLDVYQGMPSGGGGGGFFGGLGGGPAPGLSTGTAGNCQSASCPLWSSKANLEYYDMVLLACECGENNQTKPASAMQAMHDWLGEGGKVFATHFHYTWFKNGPSDFQGTASWLGSSTSAVPGPFQVDTSFPKGQAFQQWLANVGAVNGTNISLNPPDVRTSVSTVNAPTLRWIYDTSTTPQNVKYLSFLTPIGGLPPSAADAGEAKGPQYCGKAVFTDIHTSGAPSGDIPGSCSGAPMTPQQKALEFLLFDLSACVSNDTLPPQQPPPPVQ